MDFGVGASTTWMLILGVILTGIAVGAGVPRGQRDQLRLPPSGECSRASARSLGSREVLPAAVALLLCCGSNPNRALGGDELRT
jgi:hypothetical protein